MDSLDYTSRADRFELEGTLSGDQLFSDYIESELHATYNSSSKHLESYDIHTLKEEVNSLRKKMIGFANYYRELFEREREQWRIHFEQILFSERENFQKQQSYLLDKIMKQNCVITQLRKQVCVTESNHIAVTEKWCDPLSCQNLQNLEILSTEISHLLVSKFEKIHKRINTFSSRLENLVRTSSNLSLRILKPNTNEIKALTAQLLESERRIKTAKLSEADAMNQVHILSRERT